MIHSKIKIESFAKRCHVGTLGGKGLTELSLPKQLFDVMCNWGEGKYLVDLMASRENAQLSQYYSGISTHCADS